MENKDIFKWPQTFEQLCTHLYSKSSLSLLLSPSLCLSLSFSLSLSHSLSPSLSLSLSPTLTLTHSHTHTHAGTLTLNPSFRQTCLIHICVPKRPFSLIFCWLMATVMAKALLPPCQQGCVFYRILERTTEKCILYQQMWGNVVYAKC